MVVVKYIMVRGYEGVEHFHGEDLEGVIKDDILYIKEKGNDENLAIFNRWDYVRMTDTP